MSINMNIKPIRTEADNQEALTRVNQLWDAVPGTPEADEMEILAILIEAFEKQFYKIETLDPVGVAHDDHIQDVIDRENKSIVDLLCQMDKDTMSKPLDLNQVPDTVRVSTNFLNQLTIALPSSVIVDLNLKKGDAVEFCVGDAITTVHKVRPSS
jgi:antitoxin component HigA of HigAB toxin-antitoxin module